MKIAIAGASSFIGRHLLDKCIRDGLEAVAIVREQSKCKLNTLQLTNVTLVKCDMDDYNILADKVGFVDCLIYLTWNGTRGADRNDGVLQRQNFEIGLSTIKKFVDKGCKIIILAGSQAEYGLCVGKEKIVETAVASPNTEYGKYKLKLYEEVKKYITGKNVRLIEPRFFSLYGTDDYEGTMVISTLKKMLNNEPCDLTECIQTWDFLHIDDAVEGLIKLMKSNTAEGIYNFGSGESFELKHFVEIMYKITGSKSKLNFGVIPYPETGMVNVNPCVEKLKGLGWKPKVGFEDGIKRIATLV